MFRENGTSVVVFLVHPRGRSGLEKRGRLDLPKREFTVMRRLFRLRNASSTRRQALLRLARTLISVPCDSEAEEWCWLGPSPATAIQSSSSATYARSSGHREAANGSSFRRSTAVHGSHSEALPSSFLVSNGNCCRGSKKRSALGDASVS